MRTTKTVRLPKVYLPPTGVSLTLNPYVMEAGATPAVWFSKKPPTQREFFLAKEAGVYITGVDDGIVIANRQIDSLADLDQLVNDLVILTKEYKAKGIIGVIPMVMYTDRHDSVQDEPTEEITPHTPLSTWFFFDDGVLGAWPI